MISENLPRRTGLAANAAPKGFEWRGIWASIVISENLPRRTGLSADAGPGTGLEWTPGGGEAGEIRMFNHWATGPRSGLLPEGCGVATPKSVQKRQKYCAFFARVLICDASGWILGGFQQVLGGFPHVFYEG